MVKASFCKVVNHAMSRVDYCFTQAAVDNEAQWKKPTGPIGNMLSKFANRCPMCLAADVSEYELTRNYGFCNRCARVNFDEARSQSLSFAKYSNDLWLSYAIIHE